jgi:adenine/guanine/hypoxanthine permease
VWSDGVQPERSFRAVLPVPMAEWYTWFRQFWSEAVSYLPVAIPLALATVVGGIDCAESAAAAGDDYATVPIIATEGFATMIGGVFGGVIQSTPYIGHPAYKAMGARAGYTLATALFIGGAGVFGYFEWIFYLLPKSVVFPILVFVGLEITSQSFRATPKRHYPALSLSCVPALAYLASVTLKQVLTDEVYATLNPEAKHWVQTVTVLSGGFIVTSLLWGTALAKLIDGKIRAAAAVFGLAAVLSLFGVMHSPLISGPIDLPTNVMAMVAKEGRAELTASQTPYHWAAAYLAVAGVVLLIGRTGVPPIEDSDDDPRAA